MPGGPAYSSQFVVVVVSVWLERWARVCLFGSSVLQGLRGSGEGLVLFVQSEIAPVAHGVFHLLDAHCLAQGDDAQYLDRKSTRLNSSHSGESRMPSSA